MEPHANGPIPEDLRDLAVASVVQDSTGWDVDFLKEYFNESTVSTITTSPLPEPSLGEDGWYWLPEKNDNSSVRSAYRTIRQHKEEVVPGDWMKLWRSNVPEKVKMFEWLAQQGKLMTNVERCHRGFTVEAQCERCKLHEENINHALKDCEAVEKVWRRLIPPSRRVDFSNKSITNWLQDSSDAQQDMTGDHDMLAIGS